MEDLQLSILHPSVFLFSKKRKSMNMSISASKKEHLFSRILSSGCSLIINVTHTKTLVLSFLSDKIGWSKNNRHIYLQYIILYIWKTRKCPPCVDELVDFENDMMKMIKNKGKGSGDEIAHWGKIQKNKVYLSSKTDLKRINASKELLILADKSWHISCRRMITTNI